MKNTSKNNKTIYVPSCLSWLFPYKRKGLSVSTDSAIKYYIFQNKISLVIINWLFQGMRGMGKADLLGKVLLEMVLFIILLVLLAGRVKYYILAALFTAHTVNWLINAHFWDVGRFIGITNTAPARFFPYLRKLEKRLNTYTAPPVGIIIGGLSRNKGFKSSSDVDMIFVRGQGCKSTVLSVLVTIYERTRAFFCKFPLHLELYDDMDAMNRHRTDEVPVILKDSDGIAEDWYGRSGRTPARLSDFD